MNQTVAGKRLGQAARGVIYLYKVLHGGDFFINNFLWAQRCPQPRPHLFGLSRLLRGPAAASKPRLCFGGGGPSN